MEVDFLIVGGGSAGAVMANRLSADPRNRVLLVEAGPDTPPEHVPAEIFSSYSQRVYFDPKYHWTDLRVFFGSAPDATHTPQTPRKYEQARVMGGGSSINGQFAMRGLPADYDEWAKLGVKGWSYEDVLPYFRRLERDCDFGGEDHGREGPMPIRRIFKQDWSPFSHACFDALSAEGFPYLLDLNADFHDGCFPMPITNLYNRRVSTAVAYLDSATRLRSNLQIASNTVVTRLEFEQRRASGAVMVRDGKTHVVRARNIVVSAGALHSPALLMRSGFGPARHLREHDIEVVTDLPGVGQNLYENPAISVVAHLRPEARLPSWMQRPTHFGLRYSSNVPGCEPGDMMLMPSSKAAWHPLGRQLGVVMIETKKPYSRGCVRLRSASPHDEPLVSLNMLSDRRDLERLMDAQRRLYRLMESPQVKSKIHLWFVAGYSERVRKLGVPSVSNWMRTAVAAGLMDSGKWPRNLLHRYQLSPGVDVHELVRDERALEQWVRNNAWPCWHVAGTCRMGSDDDPQAVVDSKGRVRGVGGLRVVDASIMPTLVTGNPNIPTIMMAEKIADGAVAEGP